MTHSLVLKALFKRFSLKSIERSAFHQFAQPIKVHNISILQL